MKQFILSIQEIECDENFKPQKQRICKAKIFLTKEMCQLGNSHCFMGIEKFFNDIKQLYTDPEYAEKLNSIPWVIIKEEEVV